jgi:chromosome segregation ATPase
MKRLTVILVAVVLAGCASPAREGRSVVTEKPDVSRVAKPVADTRKAVESAAGNVTVAQQATAEARALAAKTAEAKALAVQLDKIELTLQTTQADLTAALAAVSESERAVTYLQTQVEAQALELMKTVEDYNALAVEKREAEVKVAEGRTREGVLWRFLIGFIVVSVIEGAVIYILIKRPF